MAVGTATSATSNNTAGASSSAGSDLLTLGGGTNVFGADSLTIETGGGSTAVANHKVNGAGAKAGGDTVTGGIGEDKGAGDTAEVYDGEAKAEVLNRSDERMVGEADVSTSRPRGVDYT